MTYKRYVKLIIEKSIKDFQNQMAELLDQDYFLVGSLVIAKKIKSLIPFHLENEYCALMQKSVKIEED
jgi:hypothetical protein